MTDALTISLTRREGLAIARDALRDLTQRVQSAGGPSYADEIYRAWHARLEAAARLCPDFRLSDAGSVALDELVHAVHRSTEGDMDTLVDWLDLLPRSALELVDVTPVAYRSWTAARRAERFGNEPAHRKEWAHAAQPAAREAAVA